MMNLRAASTTVALFVLACGFVGVRVGVSASDDAFHVDGWVVWLTALSSVWCCGAVLGRLERGFH